MPRATLYAKSKHKSLKLAHATFAVPVLALAGLTALGVGFINYDPEDFASATTATVNSKVSYNDEYITISNPALIDLSNESVTGSATYTYATNAVTVSTNVETGYELYLTSSNKTSAALTSTDSNNSTTIPTTSGTGGELGTPKALDKNTYGYAVASTQIGNTSFDADYSSPTPTSKWAGIPAGSSDRIRSTNTAVTSGETTNVHYAASLTNAIAPGEYTGSVVYSAVATPTNNTVDMTVSPQLGSTTSTTTLTITSGPTNIDSDATLSIDEVKVTLRQNSTTKYTCRVTNIDVSSGKVVTTCTAPATTTGVYDVFITIPRYSFKDIASRAYTASMPISNYTYMQDITTAACSVTAQSDSTNYGLKDKRDEKSYTIRKLADGHCWMVQDLNLSSKTITAADSDISSSFVVPGSSGYNSWCSTNSSDCDDVARVNVYNNSPHYNWYAATAGAGTYAVSSGSVESSICPKGWKMPLSQGDYSWSNLYAAYNNGSNFRESTNTGTGYWAGGYNGGTVYDSGTHCYWWTRTAQNNNNAYGLYTNSINKLYTQDTLAKNSGYPIRCVFVGS